MHRQWVKGLICVCVRVCLGELHSGSLLYHMMYDCAHQFYYDSKQST